MSLMAAKRPKMIVLRQFADKGEPVNPIAPRPVAYPVQHPLASSTHTHAHPRRYNRVKIARSHDYSTNAQG